MFKKDCSVVILAAGNAQRMGRPKFLLEMPDGTSFLENIIQQYVNFGCSDILVVLNNEGARTIKKSRAKFPPQVKIVLNEHVKFGRFYSIKTGLKQVQTKFTFIHNIDNPYAKKKVIEALYQARFDAGIVKPTIKGKGGHPILISTEVSNTIINEMKNELNFKDFLRNFIATEVSIEDDSILININTHEDYLEFYHRQTR